MLDNINAAYVQLLTLLSFGVSVLAAVLAIDMYRLLRTAEVGHSWRILIIASVIFALTLALRLAENFDWGGLHLYQLSRFGEAMFVFALAYAFYLQRRAFVPHKETRPNPEKPARDALKGEPEIDELDDLAQYYAEGGAPRGLPGR
jgi:hypothetical protein